MRATLLTICLAISITTVSGQAKTNSGLKTILNGKWITTSYLKELQATLSPHVAQQKIKQVFQLFIDIKPANKNSILTDMQTLHEGGYGFTIYFKPGVKKDTWKTNYIEYDYPGIAFSDIGYEIAGKDTQVVIYGYSKNNKLLNKIYFTKAGIAGIDDGQLLEYEVNKIIFTGTYKFTDSAGNSKTVQFANNGTITGFNGFKKYRAETFFMTFKNFNDEIYFRSDDSTSVSYAFKKQGNTILLYELEKVDKYNYKLGALKYSLAMER